MIVYRLGKEKYSSDPLNTDGAKRFGGRWNPKGKAILYASDSIALSALEILAHVHLTSVLNAFVCISITLPDDAIMLLEKAALPAD